jgi:hypothetical protein
VVGDARGNGDEFGEGAGAPVFPAGDADDLAPVAEVDLAPETEAARATVDGGIEGDAIAGREVPDSRARLNDDSCRLVPHDDGRNAAAGRAIESVHIAAADAAGRHLNE